MLRLLLVVAVRSLRRDLPRLVLTLGVVALATVLLLAGASAVPTARVQREITSSWLPAKHAEVRAGTWAAESTEYARGEPVHVLRVAAGGAPVLPPGLGALPADGTAVVSPAMADLLRTDPVLRERYPARVADLLPESAVEGPRTLRMVLGSTAAQVRARDGLLVAAFGGAGNELAVPAVVRTGAPFMVVAFLTPLLWLFVVLSRLGAGRRDRRLAAMRLMGARRSLLVRSVVAEALVLAVLGVLLGTGLFLAAGPTVGPRAPFGDGVWAAGLRTPGWAFAATAAAVPLVFCLSARLGARRAVGSALSVVRRDRERARSARWGWAALGAGIAAAVASAAWPDREAVDLRLALFVVGFVAVAAGLVRCGPALAALMAAPVRRPRSVAALLAVRGLTHSGSRTAAVGAGIALQILLAGSLLTIFPLLGAVTARADRDVADALGGSTTVVTLTGPAQLSALRAAPEVAGVLDVHTVQTTLRQDVLAGCRGIRVRTGGQEVDGCGAGAGALRPAAEQLLRMPGLTITAAAPDSVWQAPPGGAVSHLAVVQQRPGTDPEVFRNRLLRLTPGTTVQTLAESAEEASRASRPFRQATAGALALASLVALTSLALALVTHVRERHRSTWFLRLAGVRIRALWSSVLAQVVLAVVPLAALATVLSIGLARAFLALNGGSVPLPVGSILLVSALSALVAPLAALAVHPLVRRTATTRPITE